MNIKKLNWWLGSGQSFSLYPSTDKAIFAGAGPAPTLGYASFGGCARDPDNENIQYVGVRVGADHNATVAVAYFGLMRTTDGGTTWSSMINVRAAYSSPFNLFDVAIQTIDSGPNKGRVIINYSKGRAANNYDVTSPSDIYAMYSDDLKSVVDPSTATWSSEYRMFPDYGEKLDTSTTSINIAGVGSTVTITLVTGQTDLWVGRRFKMASNANASNNIVGRVQSYNAGTKVLVCDNITKSGSGTLSDWNVSLSNYAVSTGRAITLSDNSLLKVIHWNEGLGHQGYLFRSTDGGATWTYRSTIWTLVSDPAANSHEASIGIDPQTGYLWCFRRNSLASALVYSISTDQGLTWQPAVQTSVFNDGKPPFIFTDRGNIVGIGRGVGGRTILWQSTNKGATFSSQYIDAREGIYMYGDLFKLSSGHKAIWSVEAQNTPTPTLSGPTLLIQKNISESSSAISPPTTYDVDYQGWLDYGNANSETLPSDASKVIDNTYITTARSGGWLAEADHRFFMSHNSTSVKELSKRSVRKPWTKMVETASPTYTTSGWDFNGTTQYLECPFGLNTLSKFVQNSAGIYYRVIDDVTADQQYDYGAGAGNFSTVTNEFGFNPRTLANALVITCNDSTQDVVAGPNSDSRGGYLVRRLNSTTKSVYKNGSLVSDVTRNSTGLTAKNLIFGAKNFNNQVNRFATRKIGGVIEIGSSFSGFESAIYTADSARLTALGL